MENARLEPGTILAEKYRLEGVLGVGGMGTVYRAEHLALKAPVAIKIIDRDVSEDGITLARFMREAQAAASLRSPHVVQILDYGTEGDRPFMVMEMLEGEPLSDRIERYGSLTPGETYRVINHVAKAVARAHEADIVHRDLKPDNVFLVHNEGDEIAKVLDFGVAKVEATQLDGAGHTRTGSLLGTPYYMSPEQAQGNKDIDARSDLWALGVIAFECLTGRRPFSSDGLGDLVLQICIRDIPVPSQYADLPESFDQWFFKACERDPDERFQTARELAEALYTALHLSDGNLVSESRWSRSLSGGSERLVVSRLETVVGTPADPQRGEAENDDARISDRPTEVRPDSPSQRPTDPRSSAVTLALETRLDDDETATALSSPGSQWQVVPHDEPSEPIGDRVSEPLAPIPKKGGGATIAFVGLLALMIGGAVVFGVRAVGMLDDQSNATRPAPSFIPEAPEGKVTEPPGSSPGAVPETGAVRPQKARGTVSAPGTPAAPEERPPTEEEKALQGIQDEIENALENPEVEPDAEEQREGIDSAAPEQQGPDPKAAGTDSPSTDSPKASPPKSETTGGTKDAPPSDGKDPSQDPATDPAKDPAKDPTQPKAPVEGPKPTLPEHLAPTAPAPAPKPAPAPAPP